MKLSPLIALLALTSIGSAATTINLTGVSPQGSVNGDGNGQKLLGFSNFGGVVSSAANTAIPIDAASSVNVSTYSVTIGNLDLSSSFTGATNVTVTFNLALTASTGDGLVVNGVANRTWVVDDSATAEGGTINDRFRLNAGETITFAVSNVLFSGTSGSITGVSFDGFTGAAFSPNAGTFVNATGVATGVGNYANSPDTATRVDSIALNLAVVPEPSTALLGGLGMLALLRRRR